MPATPATLVTPVTVATQLPRRKLPIGIQSFAKLRQDGCYYVDKTGLAVRLINEGSYYFLSRPRRFGKSLLLDTFKELFQGNRPLFTALAADPLWDWSRKYPVIRVSFSDGVLQSRAALDQRIQGILQVNRQLLGLPLSPELPGSDIAGNFSELIRLAHQATGQRAVVLVDEYDKPILDNIDNQAVATEMREGLKNLYSVLKGADEHLKFVFLTGVSKFTKVSLFSGLNNLTDITLDERYSDICGYTDADVDSVFAAELPGLDRQLIRSWYNGYNWLGTPVYNPFGLLQLFRTRKIRPHWFETGTPTFLIKLLQQRQVFTPDLSRIVASDTLLSTFDVDLIPIEALMFQSGYLTVSSVREFPGRMQLSLKYPNLEVQSALNTCLLQSLSNSLSVPGPHITRLHDLLGVPDFTGLRVLFHAFYASIANDWFRKNELSGYEGYYASIFYSYFAALGIEIRLEDPTNVGRIDMTVLFAGQVFLFEFKVVEMNPSGSALQQLKDMAYADKYRARGEPIHLVGVEFSKTSRNIVGFDTQTL